MAALGCEEAGSPNAVQFETSLQEIDQVSLQESDSVFIGRLVRSNQFAFSPTGGIAVADRMTSRLFIFESDGQLRATAGRDGDGPGEFRSLYQVAWDANGRLWAAEVNGRITIFDSALNLDTIFTTQQVWMFGLQPAPGRMVSRVKRDSYQGNAIYTYALDGAPLDSMMMHDPLARRPYIGQRYMPVFRVMGDTILGASNLSYPLLLFTLSGDSIGSFGAPPPSIGTMRLPELGEFARDPRGATGWLESFGDISSVWVAHDTLVVVQHRRRLPDGDLTVPQLNFFADVYDRQTLSKLAEDVELPGFIVSTHEDLVWILTNEPPAPWTLTGFRLVLHER